MKNILKISILSILFLAGAVGVAHADTTINLDIESSTGSIYNQSITVAPCDSEGDGVMKVTAYCALVQSGITSDWSGLWVNSINSVVNNENGNGIYWMWLANLNINNSSSSSCDQDNPYSCSAKQYILKPNDHILFYYNTNPLSISVSNLNPVVGDSVTATVTELGLDQSFNPIWTSSSGATVTIGAQTCTTATDGTCSVILDTAGSLKAVGIKSLYISSSSIDMTVSALAPVVSHGGGSYIEPPAPDPVVDVIPPLLLKSFDTTKAFNFLISQQKTDGSFGSDLYTDWAAMAFASTSDYKIQKNQIKRFNLKNKTVGNMLTDYERRAMAVMMLGQNPYSYLGVNYIKYITDNFDGTQFGDSAEVNDDIFALIVLQNAGYNKDENILKSTISFLLSQQQTDGSWNSSVDITGAAIESLAFVKDNSDVAGVLVKAEDYLKQNQQDTGGWKNVSSTSWAMEGILALGENVGDWVKNGNTPMDYFGANQDADGGMIDSDIQNKIWETSYVAPLAMGKSWNQIMKKFSKPKIFSASSDSVYQVDNSIIEKIKAMKESLKAKLQIQPEPQPQPEIQSQPQTQPEPVVSDSKNSNSKLANLAGIASQNSAASIMAVLPIHIDIINWLTNFFEKFFR